MDFDIVGLLRRVSMDDVQRILDKCKNALERTKNTLQELSDEIIQRENEMDAEERVIQLCKYTMYHGKYQFYRKAVSVFTDMIVATDRPINSFQQMASMSDVLQASMAIREMSVSRSADKEHKRRKHKSKHRKKFDSGSDDFDFN